MRKSGLLAVVLVVVLVGALVGACGGSKKESSTAPTTTASSPSTGGAYASRAPAKPVCELLSRDDIAKAVGNPVRDPQPGAPGECTWGTDVDGGTSVDITAEKPDPSQAALVCTALRNEQASELPREQVSGLGTSAVWVWQKLAEPLVQGTLVACWKDSAVEVLLTGEKDLGALKATAIQLAKTTQARI